MLDTRHQHVTDNIRRDERLALARELHDVVAHHITGIVLQTQGARLVGQKDPAKLDDALHAIETAGTDALAAMRKVIDLLRHADDGDPTAPGSEQLSELVDRFADHGPAVHLDLPAVEMPWPTEVTATVYRLVQESLTNVARHATHAQTVVVSVTQHDKQIIVEVADDAPPAAARLPHRSGHGLLGMRERVEALGGTFKAGPKPGAGRLVQATLPTHRWHRP